MKPKGKRKQEIEPFVNFLFSIERGVVEALPRQNYPAQLRQDMDTCLDLFVE